MAMIPDNPTTIGHVVYLRDIMVDYRNQLLADQKVVNSQRLKSSIESELRTINADLNELMNIDIFSPFQYGTDNYRLNILWRKWASPTHMNR